MTIKVYLTQQQRLTLMHLQDDHKYGDAYLYLQSIVQEKQAANPNGPDKHDLDILDNWLGKAASINTNDGSFASEMVRGSTEYMGMQQGQFISDQKFQDASNKLADSVIV